MKKTNNFNMSKMQGIDSCIATSLMEYRLAWIMGNDQKSIRFWHRKNIDVNGNEYFDFCDFSTTMDIKAEFDWIEWEKVYSFSGTTEKLFFEMDLAQQVFDLLQYYGPENIFGTSYNGYKYHANINRFQYIY